MESGFRGYDPGVNWPKNELLSPHNSVDNSPTPTPPASWGGACETDVFFLGRPGTTRPARCRSARASLRWGGLRSRDGARPPEAGPRIRSHVAP